MAERTAEAEKRTVEAEKLAAERTAEAKKYALVSSPGSEECLAA